MMFDEDEVRENVENTTEAEKQLGKREIEVQETLQLLEDAIKVEEKSLAGERSNKQSVSVEKLLSRLDLGMEEKEFKEQLVSFKKPKNRQVITVHCKNLYSYMINVSNEIYRDDLEDGEDSFRERNKRPDGQKQEQGYDVFLMKEPTKLAGGA